MGRLALLTILALAMTSFGQKTDQTVLNPSNPPVYLEFVRSGKCSKDLSNFNNGHLCDSKVAEARGFDAFWLRLVNNTKWSVSVTVDKAATEVNSTGVPIKSTEYVDDDGETYVVGKMLANDRAEMDVVYKNESETGCDFSRKAPKGQRCFWIDTVPPQIPLPSISSDLFIAPGKSIVFPVNRAHVKKYVNLYVIYNFSWEYHGKGVSYSAYPAYDSQHRAYFGWFDLEKGLKKEEEKKRVA